MLHAAYRPLLFALDAERAHELTLRALALWDRAGTPFAPSPPPASLATRVAGMDFASPIGLAAGVDKDARAIRPFLALGFGSVEVGTLTPRPQSGNPKPRLFRLMEDEAVINRMGFNNGGLAAAVSRLRKTRRRGLLGVNVGVNKDADDRIAGYVAGIGQAAPHADYVTINISSPNTPGLRDLQHGAALAALLAAGRAAAGATPLFLKVAPDLDAAQIDDIARQAVEAKIDALIVGNTTVSRPVLRSGHREEAGGLSGAPLRSLAARRLADFRAATGGALPLVAVGGIDSGAEAYARIRGGASLVQLYTALAYKGPGLVRTMTRDLAALLARDGFTGVAQAVGTGAA